MDANGHRFWLFADAADFDLSDARAAWNSERRTLRLSGRVRDDDVPLDRGAALAMSNLPPVAIDGFGTWAWFDPASARVFAAGALDQPEAILDLPAGARVHDMIVDRDGVLCLALEPAEDARSLLLADLRGRWADPFEIETGAEGPDRLALGADGALWAINRESGAVWTLAGRPLHDLARHPYAPTVFRPAEENPDPPRLVARPAIEAGATETIVDCAARADGTLAVLVLRGDSDGTSRIAFLTPAFEASAADLPGQGFPGSLGWVSEDRLAALFPGLTRARVYEAPPGPLGATLASAQARFPVRTTAAVRFCRGALMPASYVSWDGSGSPSAPLPLHSLSLPSYASAVTVPGARPIDSGARGTVWHRAYLEASLPPGTGITLRLAAAESVEELEDAPFFDHRFGDAGQGGPSEEPVGAWLPDPSELPFHSGLLDCPSKPGRAGLFVALVQRAGRISRELKGRYLKLELVLQASGQATPVIAGIRIYGPRFSYVDHYLPPIYRGDPDLDGEAEGVAANQDFLSRYVTLFENLLTRIEDKVAAAHLVTSPWAAPPDALEWLANWIGVALDLALPEDRQRRILAETTAIYRKRGTLPGLAAALDAATGGQVANGGLVIVEDFRLRRTFATILGADLGRREDPLLQGFVESGNSFVGPTLFIGEGEIDRLSKEQQIELAALFIKPALESEAREADIAAFFEQLAFQVTVLVHAEMADEEVDLVRRITVQETPAHVRGRVFRASQPLIVGLYALVGVDSYLRARPGLDPVRVGTTRLGEKDHLVSLPSLDPRLEQGGSP